MGVWWRVVVDGGRLVGDGGRLVVGGGRLVADGAGWWAYGGLYGQLRRGQSHAQIERDGLMRPKSSCSAGTNQSGSSLHLLVR